MRCRSILGLLLAMAFYCGCEKGKQPQDVAKDVTDRKQAVPTSEAQGGRVEEAKAVLKRVLGDWVFGGKKYSELVTRKEEIRFNCFEYEVGYSLSSFEITAAREKVPGSTISPVEVAARMAFPMTGEAHEITRTVLFDVWPKSKKDGKFFVVSSDLGSKMAGVELGFRELEPYEREVALAENEFKLVGVVGGNLDASNKLRDAQMKKLKKEEELINNAEHINDALHKLELQEIRERGAKNE